jgi:biotin/methionine sulfoxide reductase
MLPIPPRPTIVTHWGTYRAILRDGVLCGLEPHGLDPDPSPLGDALVDPQTRNSRILHPAVRDSFLTGSLLPEGQGREPLAEVSWDQALDLAASERDRVRTAFGNQSIFGGSYGWASARRFYHATSQIHRFLNAIGDTAAP